MKVFLKLRRGLSVAAVSTALSFTPNSPAHAQAVVLCLNCSDIINQLISYALQIEQYVTEANQLRTQIEMYADMVKNSRVLNAHNYTDVMNNLRRIDGLMGQARGIAYNAGDLEGRFARLFPGYQTYATRAEPVEMEEKYQEWSEGINTSTAAVFQAAREQNEQFTSEGAVLDSLRRQNAAAQGRQESLQIANDMSAESIGQLQKVRQLLLLQIQQQGSYYQMLADQDAQRSANGVLGTRPSEQPQGQERF